MDSQTILLLAGMTQFLLHAMTWSVMRRQASSAVAWWCLGGMSTGIGLTLVAVRALVPAFLSYEIANGLLICGLLLMAHSLWLQHARRANIKPAALYGLFFVLVYWALDRLHLPALRSAWTRGNLLLLLLVIAWIAWQMSRAVRSFNANAISLAFLAVATALGGLLIGAGDQAAWHDPIATHIVLSSVYLAAFLHALISSLCYIGLALDRGRVAESRHAESEARWHELQRRRHEVAQLERKCSIPMLSALLAQDIGRPIAEMEAAVQLGREALRQREWSRQLLQDCLGRIIIATERARLATDRVRRFLKPRSEGRGRFELRELTERVLQLLEPDLLAYQIRVGWAAGSESGAVQVEGDQLSQAICHLLRHAVEAMHESARRELHLRCECGGQRVRLEIRDTGAGLPEDSVSGPDAILSSRQRDGSGLGIAVARAIVEEFDGHLLLRPADGGGLVVAIDLPAADSPEQA